MLNNCLQNKKHDGCYSENPVNSENYHGTQIHFLSLEKHPQDGQSGLRQMRLN
jgi:hypothetical protein